MLKQKVREEREETEEEFLAWIMAAQIPKMRELWDNEDDEIWDTV